MDGLNVLRVKRDFDLIGNLFLGHAVDRFDLLECYVMSVLESFRGQGTMLDVDGEKGTIQAALFHAR